MNYDFLSTCAFIIHNIHYMHTFQVCRIMAKSILFMTSRNNIKTKMQQTQIECSEINTHIIEITKIFVRFLCWM